jgi:hypothetical protein
MHQDHPLMDHLVVLHVVQQGHRHDVRMRHHKNRRTGYSLGQATIQTV